MKTAGHEYGRIAALAENLEKAGIAADVRDRIMEGGAAIRNNTTPERKAAWMKDAMDRMDGLLDEETCRAVRESCACCLGGLRLAISKRIARENESLDDRIRAADEAKRVCGHSVTRLDERTIKVCFQPEGWERYRCVCLPKASGPFSVTYCYCCAGHAKHHLQIALGRGLEGVVQSSALSSEGREPCVFIYRIEE